MTAKGHNHKYVSPYKQKLSTKERIEENDNNAKKCKTQHFYKWQQRASDDQIMRISINIISDINYVSLIFCLKT